jgi:hypothetical protein
MRQRSHGTPDDWLPGYRFVYKIKEPLTSTTVHRSLAITYTYQEPGIRSLFRANPSLVYLSFIVRSPSIQVRLRRSWQRYVR